MTLDHHRPLRVGIIAPPFLAVPPVGYGGTENVLHGLAVALAAAGHEPVLYTVGSSACPVERRWLIDDPTGLPIGDELTGLTHADWAYVQASLDDLDVLHDHTTAGTVVGRPVGIPRVCSNRNPFDPHRARLFARAAAQGATVTGLSHHHASTGRTAGVPVDTVIHNGVLLDDYRPGRGDGGYCLFLGRLDPTKGVDLAIRAARSAGVPLVIAAKARTGAELAYLEDVVRPQLDDEVVYAGEVGGDEKVALLGGACALLNPIRWDEPFGMVMIEAMACGTPVVTTGYGSSAEVVDHGVTGFVCGTGVDQLAAGVYHAARLDRDTVYEHALGRWSAGRMAADHVALYQRLLASTGSLEGVA